MLRSAIYRLKRIIHGRPWLYRWLYGVATFNLDYCRQQLQAQHYPSRFGGMWTDRDDFRQQLDTRLRAGSIDPGEADRLRAWREQGFVVLAQAIDHGLIDQYLDELSALKAAGPCPLLMTAASLPDPSPYTAEAERQHQSVRVVDDYFFSEASRRILMHPRIMSFLASVFDRPAELTQSLGFARGSQQDMHQDTAFVRMNSPLKLAATWVALEDIQPGSGELTYYPGSHRWEDYLFSGYFKHFDEERDGPGQLQDWYAWIHRQAAARGCEAQGFLPRKGDVFIWHAALAHGGAPILDPDASRLSLVGHYCPQGVRPLYHYYKPAQRQYFRHGEHRYCSSYYRV